MTLVAMSGVQPVTVYDYSYKYRLTYNNLRLVIFRLIIFSHETRRILKCVGELFPTYSNGVNHKTTRLARYAYSTCIWLTIPPPRKKKKDLTRKSPVKYYRNSVFFCFRKMEDYFPFFDSIRSIELYRYNVREFQSDFNFRVFSKGNNFFFSILVLVKNDFDSPPPLVPIHHSIS